MAYTLSNLLQDTYRKLGQIKASKATNTASSTTLIYDTTIDGAQNDDYKNGAAFIVRTDDGAAPQGEFSRVSAFTASDKKFTLASTLTAGVESGDVFAYTGPQYPLQQMIEFANAGLQHVGLLPLVDIATLTTAEETTEYAASVVWKKSEPMRVDVQTNKVSGDYQWTKIGGWEYIPAAAGSEGLIILDSQPVAGYVLRVWYLDSHPILADYDDVVHEGVHPNLAIAATMVETLTWMAGRTQGQEFVLQQLNDAKDMYEIAKRRHRIPSIGRDVKLFTGW